VYLKAPVDSASVTAVSADSVYFADSADSAVFQSGQSTDSFVSMLGGTVKIELPGSMPPLPGLLNSEAAAESAAAAERFDF
jgi:hypothetical protein